MKTFKVIAILPFNSQIRTKCLEDGKECYFKGNGPALPADFKVGDVVKVAGNQLVRVKE